MSVTERNPDPPDIADYPMDSMISPARRSDSPGIHPVATQAFRTEAPQPGVKRPRLKMRHFNKGKTGEINMTKIAAVLAVICALNAFVTYPSADERHQAAVESVAQAS